MAIRNIVKIGDPILRKTSRKVVNFDKKLWQLLDDMKDTLKKADGAGLAAVCYNSSRIWKSRRESKCGQYSRCCRRSLPR